MWQDNNQPEPQKPQSGYKGGKIKLDKLKDKPITSEQKPMMQGNQGQQTAAANHLNLNDIVSPELSDYEYAEEQSSLKKKEVVPKVISLSARESRDQQKSEVSIGQVSLNSVTDEYYIAAHNETE